MGKKLKKDEKAPPEDVFDPLQIESRQAATVVLMLNSPEEDVQAKACEAIYKFVEKCDENKKLLLDLGSVDPLLKLLQCEDRIVRRNSCMALGVMAAYADVRKALRKREETVPAFINLLQLEDDTVSHEFSALALSYMATEFSSKVAIFENNGIEPLVRCLSASDPDVQKNAVEALAQMLMDYQTRSSIRDYNGLQPVIDLLKSEYSVIQKLSLLSLDRASQDSENRRVLRELEAMSKLIDFVAHPEYNDLHVMAVMVLSNLLEDLESIEQIKETGGLKKLVALITDKTPPEEEPKGKGDKKAGSRGAKKSAKESAKKSDAEKEDMPPGDAVFPTLPDVKMCAAKAIARSARNAENRKMLHEQETEKMLIHLLGNEAVDVQIAAAQAIGIMCENIMSKDSIREWEGIQPLIKILNSDNGDLKEAVTLALANLTTANMTNCQEISNFNGIEPLIATLNDPREEAIANACVVLTNMSQDENLRGEAQSKGIVAALVEPLKSGNKFVQAKAALCVAAHVCDAESRADFRTSGGLGPLVQLLKSGNDEVRRNTCWAVTVCCVDEPTASEICKLGGLEILQEVQLSTTRKNAFTDAALNKMLDSNLSAKYALNGQLGYGNLIEDGFFDAGQLKPGVRFLTLEDYHKQEMNDKRPILLVNAKFDPSVNQNPTGTEVELKQESSKSSISGKSSRTGRETKGKTKAHKEKEEKAKEDEIQAQIQKEAETVTPTEVKPFVPPQDANLVKYVDEVTEKIQPLPNTRAQVVALAQFVAEKMGGPIERDQVANFSWELPIGQIKFELKSNIVPIGKIKTGIHIHRALLFKALADRIAVAGTLTRGEYNRAWNEVMLTDENDTPGSPKFPPKPYIVDLIHKPGNLLLADSPEAISYRKI